MNDFSIHRGEAKNKMLTVLYNGAPYELKDGEYYQFEVYEDRCYKNKLIDKRLDGNKLSFENADTASLKRNSYPYMIKLYLYSGEFMVVVDDSFITIK